MQFPPISLRIFELRIRGYSYSQLTAKSFIGIPNYMVIVPAKETDKQIEVFKREGYIRAQSTILFLAHLNPFTKRLKIERCFDRNSTINLILSSFKKQRYFLNRYRNYVLFYGNEKIGKIDYLTGKPFPLN